MKKTTSSYRAGINVLKCIVAGLCMASAASAMAQSTVNGFAAVSAQGITTTTGGGNAAPTIVTTYAQLASAVSGSTARVIIISGTINTTDGGGSSLAVGPNKTLLGADQNATIYGGISLSSNTIVRYLNLQGTYPNSGPDDVLHVQGVNVHHIWIDHCNIWNATDGNLDITGQSSYVTVSWCKFWYTDSSHPHRLSCLIGSGGGDHPEDWGYLKVTYHHNWFANLVNERMPRLMYGQAHTYNNYYTCSGNLYCIGVGSYGSMLIENNYFNGVNNPHQFMYTVWCYIVARGNTYVNTTGLKDNGLGGSADATGQSFDVQPFNTPPYSYTLDSAANVPSIVQAAAGPLTPAAKTYEAESGTLGGGAVVSSSFAGASGGQCVDLPTSGGYVQINNVTGIGRSAKLVIRYSNGGTGPRTGQLIINGVAQNFTTPQTGSWTTWQTITVNANLNGDTGNTIRFQSNGQDLGLIDSVTVTP